MRLVATALCLLNVYPSTHPTLTLNSMPEEILLHIIKNLGYNELQSLKGTSSSFSSALDNIFDFKEKCDVVEVWPVLELNLRNELIYSPQCLEHLRQNCFLYSWIRLFYFGNSIVGNNYYLLKDIVRDKLDPQIGLQIYHHGLLRESQIQKYFSEVGNRKLSLKLESSAMVPNIINSLYLSLKDLNLINLEILYPFYSDSDRTDLTHLFFQIKTLKSFIIRKASDYYISSTKMSENLRNSALTHFEMHGIPTDIDRILRGEKLLVAIVNALPLTVTSLSCSASFHDYMPISNILNIALKNRQVSSLELEGFASGFTENGIILLAINMKNGFLKHLSLKNSYFFETLGRNAQLIWRRREWNIRIISAALHDSKLKSLSLHSQLNFDSVWILQALMKAVSRTPSMRELDLSHNFIDENGCAVIAKNLGSLERLTLDNNFIGK